MKRTATIVLSTLLVISAAAGAQSQTQPAAKPKTLAATVGVYVFPEKGQPPDRQSKDEAACYKWAVGNTGVDPFEVQKTAQQQAQQAEAGKQQAAEAGKGSGAKGTLVGAGAGALIGGIAGDAGKGAAIGAATGLVAGRVRGRQKSEQAQQQVEQQAQQAQQVTYEQQQAFKKAFAACLEAKKYVVKF